MTPRVQELINTFSLEIDRNLWFALYEVFATDETLDYPFIGEFTECMIEAGIDPSQYLDSIPCGYLYGTNIPHIDIRDGIKSISSWAFSNCHHISSIELPKSVENVAENAFANSGTIGELIIMNPDVEIDNFAFYDCVIDTIYYNGTEAQWDEKDYYVDFKRIHFVNWSTS